jgi:HK97 family phage portal protein
MSFINSVKTLFGKDNKNGEAINSIYAIEVPESIYVREMAVYSAISLIANAISQSEIRVYENNKPVMNEDYFTLNVKANPNESASAFWHKVMEKALRAEQGKGALCFINRRNIYCADQYTVEEKRPFKGNIYSGIVVDDFQMDRKFRADEVFIFKLEDTDAYNTIRKWNAEYGKLISVAMNAYKDTNAKKFVLKVEGLEAGNAKFKEEFEKYLKEPIQKFVNGDTEILIEYDGRTLSEMERKRDRTNSEDSIKLIEETFKVAGKAFKIPESLMLGNITNMNDVIKSFLTFAVDPWADMIGKVLTGQYGYEEWEKGNYYKCDTSTVNHIDIFDMAEKIDKLISSSFACVDEVREKAGLDKLNEEWSSKHLLTKNYEFTENILKEGGSESEKTATE